MIDKIASLKNKEKVKTWNNEKNNSFYENLKPHGLKEFAELAGLSSGCDVELIKNYWAPANSILEIGAGYGRVINFLITNNFSQKIVAVERSYNMFQLLKEQFKKSNNIDLIRQDIFNFHTYKRFDLILMLWSGMADFETEEQLFLFYKLKNMLSTNGKLIIDTMPELVTPLLMEQTQKNNIYKLKHNESTIYTYSMSAEEIENNARKSGFSVVKHIPYDTSNKRKRFLHILS